MSFTAACGWTLGRSLLVALLCLPIAWGLRSRLDGMSPRQRAAAWALLLIAFFTPALLTGYAYSKWSLALIRHPFWNEVLYGALLTLRLVPVGVLILQFCPPPPLSAEALYCARLHASRIRGLFGRAWFLLPFILRGPLRDALPVFAVVFLMSFQEFETASLMGTASWTVWLFDAQAGGVLLGESLRKAMGPAACEAVVIGVFLIYAWRTRWLPSAPRRQPGRTSRARDAGAWLLAAVAFCGAALVPVLLLTKDAVRGIDGVLRNGEMLREIGTAAGFGLSSGLIAASAAYGLRRVAFREEQSLWQRGLALAGMAAALPGLMGSLMVSLIALRLFQLPVLNAAYDTPAPAVLALVVHLLPRAVILQMLFGALTNRTGTQTARLLVTSTEPAHRRVGRELLWRLKQRPQWLAAGILCLWGYLELTPVAILAPPGVTSAPVRLYNLMHYGRSFSVAAMTLVAMAAPPLLLLAITGLRRLALRLRAA